MADSLPVLGTLPAEDPPPNPPLPMTTFIAVQPTGIKKQRTLFDVGLKTVAKGASIVVSNDHSIRLHPAVVQQQEQRRQAQRGRELRAGEPPSVVLHVAESRPVESIVLQRPVSKRAVLLRTVLAEMTRSIEPAYRKDVQQGKRGPYAGGLGRWPQHLKSLAIERHTRRYPGWLNIPMKSFNGQPARGVLGPWGAVNDTTAHLNVRVVVSNRSALLTYVIPLFCSSTSMPLRT